MHFDTVARVSNLDELQDTPLSQFFFSRLYRFDEEIFLNKGCHRNNGNTFFSVIIATIKCFIKNMNFIDTYYQ